MFEPGSAAILDFYAVAAGITIALLVGARLLPDVNAPFKTQSRAQRRQRKRGT